MAREKEYPLTETPKIPPTHPGEILREDVLPTLGMTVSDAARELRVSRQTLHRTSWAGAIDGVEPLRRRNRVVVVEEDGCLIANLEP